MSASDQLDSETRLLAAMAYGEASPRDLAEEMSALASVLVRQRDARGYPDMAAFVAREKTFSFVVSDGNVRYRALLEADQARIAADAGMRAALAAARNALAGGVDLSNGAWFWDGADIKTNYRRHPKVRRGIRFSDPSHNIYAIPETRRQVLAAAPAPRDKAGARPSGYDHVYVSTAALGGTVFWKLNPDFVAVNRSKEWL